MKSLKNLVEHLLGTKHYIVLRERWFLLNGSRALCPKLKNWWLYVLDAFWLMPRGEYIFNYVSGLNITFRTRTFDSLIHLEIFGHGAYAKPFEQGKSFTRIVDLGAQTGVFALYALQRAPEASIVCVEAVGENFELLRKNIQNNGFSGRTTLLHNAVWSRTGETIQMWMHANNTGGHSAVHTGAEFSEGEQVSTLSLADVLGNTQCDLLKIDIEGTEYEVLLSADSKTLQLVKTIIAEVDGQEEDNARLVKHLQNSGFTASLDGRILWAERA